MDSLECLSKECIVLLHKHKLLKTLIKNELRDNIVSKVEIESSLKESIIEELKRKLNIPDKESFEKLLSKESLKVSEFENLALRDIRLKKYCKENFNNKVGAWFLKRKNELDFITYSLIRVKEFNKARELYLRIKEGDADFGDMATKHSEGIEKKARGIIGPIEVSKAHPTLAKILLNATPGVIISPQQIQDFYVVVRVESYDPAKLDDFMRERMAEELFVKWLEDQGELISQKLLDKTMSDKKTTERL